MKRFNMHKASQTYYDRVYAYMANNLNVCLDCPYCRVEREKGEAWGSSYTHTYYECDVLDGLVNECPQVDSEGETDE